MRRGGWTYFPDSVYNRLVTRAFGAERIIWSGYIGDVLGGSHLGSNSFVSWTQASELFARSQQWSRSVKVAPGDYNPLSSLPKEPLFSIESISPIEQLSLTVRQMACTLPIVKSGSADVRFPYMDPEWVRFIMGAPQAYRVGTRLYEAILYRFDPRLFSLPDRQRHGLARNASSMRIYSRKARSWLARTGRKHMPWIPWPLPRTANYIDYDRGLRERGDLMDIVYGSLENLAQRGVVEWLAPLKLWKRHQARQINCADALLVLTGLELNLQVWESIQEAGEVNRKAKEQM